MKKFTQYAQQGFTLIEILIVVVIIGVLAVGLIAALDPFEQIRKTQDTTLQASAKQVYDANVRYNGLNGFFPWGAGSTNCDPAEISGGVAVNSAEFNNPGASPNRGCLNILIDSGEIASSFLSNLGTTNATKLIVSGTTTATRVCFIPDSKSFASKKTFNSTGGSGNTHYCIGN